MAKLTSRTSLTEFADGDFIHVVDVSDTTSDAEGTSKKSTWSLVKSTLESIFEDLSNKATDLTTVNNTLYLSSQATVNAIDSTAAAFSLYVDDSSGSDATGDGTLLKPFKTIQAAINSFTAGDGAVIYMKSSSNSDIVFRTDDTNISIVYDPDTIHTGNITLVATNSNINFFSNSGSAILSGTINDGCSGNVDFFCKVLGTYNKTGGSGVQSPSGKTRFRANVSDLDLNLTGNTTVEVTGYGAMGVLSQSNGVFFSRHSGTIICPVITGGADPSTGYPITIFQGNQQLLVDGGGNSLLCSADNAVVYLGGISTAQDNPLTFGKIDFTGSGAAVVCLIWASANLASSGDVFPTNKLLANVADYLSANRTSTNYTATDSSVKGHLTGIDNELGGKQDTLPNIPSFDGVEIETNEETITAAKTLAADDVRDQTFVNNTGNLNVILPAGVANMTFVIANDSASTFPLLPKYSDGTTPAAGNIAPGVAISLKYVGSKWVYR